MDPQLIQYIPLLPAAAAVLCGLCACGKKTRVLAAPICIAALLGALALSYAVSPTVWTDKRGFVESATHVVKVYEWIHVGREFTADFAFLLDPLTVVMLFVVTGIGSLVAIYAAGYMAGDRGYARFFAFVSLFIFAMTTLVLADNLVLLYLGWEGVGLCSYLLIGYYYQKPGAVAAAKKAFIVNRIGDLGFALGILLAYTQFGTVSISAMLEPMAVLDPATLPWTVKLIPFLLMLGAFGKSAQLPLYVWLPDAMEGPTPVSALIHAATMVTAGVYMVARLLPLFVLSPYALPTVAVVGGLTAIFAATIALCQYDIKRIYAYSTISQLGYMFLGVGVLGSVGAIFHLFTHAFFKALLFLTAGSVMHALAGQLDLRKMSGLRAKMPITCGLMFVGCLALAGFPFTAGFYSKDMILADALAQGLGGHRLFFWLAVIGLVTALLTAFYTFRLWFRVFMGPAAYEFGDEHHGEDSDHHHAGQQAVEHHQDAHEVNWLMNAPLLVLAAGALLAGYFGHHWMEHMIAGSTASPAGHAGHGEHHLWGLDLHTAMMILSGVIAVTGIAAAAYFHWLNRAAADRAAEAFKGAVKLLANKYYVDEINDRLIVQPLHLLGQVCYAIDRLLIDGLVMFVGFVPKALGLTVRPAQRGVLQGYGLGMAAGAAVIVLLILWAVR